MQDLNELIEKLETIRDEHGGAIGVAIHDADTGWALDIDGVRVYGGQEGHVVLLAGTYH